jgi:hypothetical protein
MGREAEEQASFQVTAIRERSGSMVEPARIASAMQALSFPAIEQTGKPGNWARAYGERGKGAIQGELYAAGSRNCLRGRTK